jgi:pimeloyl-ACP methyl ester carboxylesterase
MKRWIPAVLLLAFLVLIGYVLSPQGRLLAEALSLLADVWSVGSVPAGETGREGVTLSYPGPGGEPRQADIYCEDSPRPQARLLLVHGLVETGKDDSRLRTLGRAFARHRFLVMVPDLPGMRALRVGPGDIEEVRSAIRAVRLMDGCPSGQVSEGGEMTSPAQTGVVGFSYSAGPVLLALDGPREQGADFAVLFGGYFDLAEVILFLTTGRHRDMGLDQNGEVLPEGRWILLQANSGTIADAADRKTLDAIARMRRQDPEADISALAATLGPAARAALELLANTEPGRFDLLLQKVEPELRQVIDALSPDKSLTRPLELDLYLLHGRGDAVVPYTQSVKLSRGVRTTGTIRLVLLGGFRHARPERDGAPAWWATALRFPADSVRLAGILREILARREELPLTRGGPDRR